jgi:DNA-binding NarL/FixJ family response regulator
VTKKIADLDVLLVEDSETDTKLVVQELRKNGFAPRWERVETASSLREALRRKDWDLVVSDSSLPRLSALEALATTKELAPCVPFIVVSGTIMDDAVVAVMRMGAADYVTKDRLQRLGPAVARERRERAGRNDASGVVLAEDAERQRSAAALFEQFVLLLTELKRAVEAAERHRGSMRAEALADALDHADRALRAAEAWSSRASSHPASEAGLRARGSGHGTSPVERLTPRQREILQLIAEGQSTKEMAQRLRISAKTVESHRAQIMERLDIRHVAGLVRYAIRIGLANQDV